jgi:hypothetical protein
MGASGKSILQPTNKPPGVASTARTLAANEATRDRMLTTFSSPLPSMHGVRASALSENPFLRLSQAIDTTQPLGRSLHSTCARIERASLRSELRSGGDMNACSIMHPGPRKCQTTSGRLLSCMEAERLRKGLPKGLDGAIPRVWWSRPR